MRKRGGGALLALAVSSALAQEQERDAVVVTATRVEQPSLQVPASIDRVQAEDIRSMRPQINLSESLGRVPGITVQNRQNYAQDLQVQSRGFGARSTFGIRGLRLIADGIPASQPDGQGQVSHFDLGSAERIEVLRGPFAPMYGNAAGGVINIITEPGSRDPGIGTDLSFGSYDTWKAGFRAAGVSGRTDGIVDVSRFETGGYRDHSSARRDLANVRLGIGMGSGTGLTLVANSAQPARGAGPGRADARPDGRQPPPGGQPGADLRCAQDGTPEPGRRDVHASFRREYRRRERLRRRARRAPIPRLLRQRAAGDHFGRRGRPRHARSPAGRCASPTRPIYSAARS